MSQSLNSVPVFDGYWKARMALLLKSIKVWQIVEIGWSPPSTVIAKWIIVETSARPSNDKALHAHCQALSPSKFSRISHCESAQEA
jgi:hypothetical protein